MIRVMFVDDEPNILSGLRRMLRPFRREWDMSFAPGAQEALSIMADDPVDIVVSDMRMPDYDGAYLLAEVRRLYPSTARIILSGHAQQEMAIRSVCSAHQFLAKPCDAETLRETVSRTSQLRLMMTNPELRRITSEIGQLPSVPSLYAALSDEMAVDEPDMKRVASIVADDLAMSAKILQLVNSAFFGLRRSVSSIENAVAYLGLDVIRSLVLSESAFRMFDGGDGSERAEQYARRGQQVALLARAVAVDLADNRVMVEESAQAAMLHELGKLILYAEMPQQLNDIEVALEAPGDRMSIERSKIGVCHGEIGAYLLGLWGLSDGIIEAIAYFAQPSASVVQIASPLLSLHVARALYDERADLAEIQLDEAWLGEIGLSKNIDAWRKHAEQVFDKRNAA